jgi:mRNA-degrading endonuclease YafQ of YafQ-DinJ toxin-antitoxin module
MDISYTPTFIKQLASLEKDLQSEAIEKIELFLDTKNHLQLKTHKLKGRLKGKYSFSVNYKTRIVFSFLSRNEVVLLAVGDHDVYKN